MAKTEATSTITQSAAGRRTACAEFNLNDILHSLPVGVALFDDETRLVACNKAFIALNAPIGEFLTPGVHWETLLRETAKRRWARHAAGRESAWVRDVLCLCDEYKSFEIERTDGSVVAVHVRPTANGGFSTSLTDITAQVAATRSVRDSEKMLSQILQASPANLCMSSIGSGEIIYRSPSCAALFGSDATARDHFAERAQRADFLAELLPSGRVDNFSAHGRNALGETFPALFSARIIEFKGEEVMVSTVTDLSERIAMERQLARQQEMLHQSEKLSALGELLASVAHELNNPLSVVVGHALMLQEEVTDVGLAKRANKIGAAAERCSRIVKAFLAMARHRPTNLESVQINAVIATAVDVASYGLQSSGAKLIIDLAEDLPDLRADPDQLAQVFANLIVNAEHALKGRGGDGRLTISSSLSSREKTVVVVLQDNGPGVPEAIRARIFEPFFTTKAVGRGTGVGLALCHRIIEAHGGRISVDNAPGGGARFVIELPSSFKQASAGKSQTSPTPTQRGFALVVDDEAEVAELIVQILQADGFEAEAVSSAEAAMERLTANVAVILSDVNMPGLGGAAFLSTLREKWPRLVHRLGFITGDTMGTGVSEFLRVCGRPYLEKPASPTEIKRLAAELAVGSGGDNTPETQGG